MVSIPLTRTPEPSHLLVSARQRSGKGSVRPGPEVAPFSKESPSHCRPAAVPSRCSRCRSIPRIGPPRLILLKRRPGARAYVKVLHGIEAPQIDHVDKVLILGEGEEVEGSRAEFDSSA